MELVRNKWNGRVYKVLEQKNDMVTLQRDDDSKFTIEEKEFQLSYKEYKPKGIDKVN